MAKQLILDFTFPLFCIFFRSFHTKLHWIDAFTLKINIPLFAYICLSFFFQRMHLLLNQKIMFIENLISDYIFLVAKMQQDKQQRDSNKDVCVVCEKIRIASNTIVKKVVKQF